MFGSSSASLIHDLKQRLLGCFIGALLIFALSPFMTRYFSYSLSFNGQEYVYALLVLIIYCYGCFPFIRGAAGEIARYSPSSMVLIFLGVSVLCAASLFSLFSADQAYDSSLLSMQFALVVLILLAGYFIDTHIRTSIEKGHKDSLFAQIANLCFFALTVLISLGMGAYCFLAGMPLSTSLEKISCILLVACPQLFLLAQPLVCFAIRRLCEKEAITLSNYVAFEEACDSDIVMFDKTGILTVGVYEVSDLIARPGISEEDLLGKIVALEMHSTHPLARALIQKAHERSITIPAAFDCKVIVGKGMRGIIDGVTTFVGNIRIIEELESTNPEHAVHLKETKKIMKKLAQSGKSVLIVATSEQIMGVVACGDATRPASLSVCTKLRTRGFECAVITSDSRHTAHVLANELSIPLVFADVLPKKKASKIRGLQREGKKIAFIGHGETDRAALKQADVGISFENALAESQAGSDITLVGHDLKKVADIFTLSCTAKRKRVQNFLYAAVYNTASLCLVAGVLELYYSVHVVPAFCAASMVASTLLIALNSRIIFYRRAR